MKFANLIFFMLLSPSLFAQRLNGMVADKFTGLPIANATVKKGSTVQLTYYDGYFSVTKIRFGDTIHISGVGYKPYNLVIGMRYPDTVKVYLEPNSIILDNVAIYGRRNFKLDSIGIRKEFAKIFTYKAPTFKDAVIKVDPNTYTPNSYINSLNNTTSIIGVDVLSLIGVFNKNRSPQTKLHRLALQDEEFKYVNRIFSKQKTNSITRLRGDSLQNFMDRYRPSAAQLKGMSDYDVGVYIKDSYHEFIKPDKALK